MSTRPSEIGQLDQIIKKLDRMTELIRWLVVASPRGTEFLQEEARRDDQRRQKR